jgi:hypothetical protein
VTILVFSLIVLGLSAYLATGISMVEIGDGETVPIPGWLGFTLFVSSLSVLTNAITFV